MTDREIAESGTILRVGVGSHLSGLSLDGASDRDELGICVEPREVILGLRRFEQWVYRTQGTSVRSGPGDLDLTIYGLKKFARLAVKGNPTILLLFFASDAIVRTEAGMAIQDAAPLFLSRAIAAPFLGYMVAQRQRLVGERGQMRVKRPELVDAHGYDTKYAMHVLRLGVQGVEVLETGRITLPMPEPERSRILAVRRGETSLHDTLTWAGELEEQFRDAKSGSPLPEAIDRSAVNEFLAAVYEAAWYADA